MVDLDLKDRKILYQLDLNCRQSNAQIGKKVGLSRKVVEYRIKRMEDDDIITGYWTDINSFILGYNVFRIYITFQNASSDIKKEIIQYFSNYKNTYVVASTKGEIDLIIVIWVKSIYEFYNFWTKTLDLYEDYFVKAITSIYVQTIEYLKSYLVNEEEKADRELYKLTCSEKTAQIDEVDYQLLKELVDNARIPLVKLANKLGSSSQKVKYRIDKLMKKGVLQAYRIAIDVSKLGLHMYKLDIYLKGHRYRKSIIAYLCKKSYFVTLNVAIGWANIEPEVFVRNVDKLIEVMEDLESKFPGAIKRQSFLVIEKVHMQRTLPEIEFK